jgi:putative endonuclease
LPTVYILSSVGYGTLYIGVTSDLCSRIAQHRRGEIEGFTKKYGVFRLVYFETHPDMPTAIKREKQMKKWNRAWKIELIEKSNPHWVDLYVETCGPDDYVDGNPVSFTKTR